MSGTEHRRQRFFHGAVFYSAVVVVVAVCWGVYRLRQAHWEVREAVVREAAHELLTELDEARLDFERGLRGYRQDVLFYASLPEVMGLGRAFAHEISEGALTWDREFGVVESGVVSAEVLAEVGMTAMGREGGGEVILRAESVDSGCMEGGAPGGVDGAGGAEGSGWGACAGWEGAIFGLGGEAVAAGVRGCGWGDYACAGRDVAVSGGGAVKGFESGVG